MKTGKYILMGILLSGCSAQQKHRETKSPETLIHMAESLKKSGQITSALHMYEQALVSNPNHVGAKLGMVATLREMKRHDQAITLLQNHLVKNTQLEEPKSEEIMRELGKTYIVAHMPAEGIKHYQEMLKLYPNDVWAMTGMGICLDLDAQYGLAQTWYKKALEKSPDNMKILSNYGLSLALSGNYQESLDILIPLSQSPEATANVRHNLATAYALSGKPELARKIYNEDLKPEEAERNLSRFGLMR